MNEEFDEKVSQRIRIMVISHFKMYSAQQKSILKMTLMEQTVS